MRAGTSWILAVCALTALASAAARGEDPPDLLLVTVDTLRADHVSIYGYARSTTPVIDRLLEGGVRFTQARTVEPLTGPALASMLTSLHPHEHGATRNGLRVRSDLVSFPQIMSRRGYRTAAFVANWTLRDELSGLAEYFDTYDAVLTRKRWFGVLKREATADDVNEEAIAWLKSHVADERRQPFLLWVHYVEPHAPYRLRKEFLDQIGINATGSFFSPRNRYDTEVAYVDDRIGSLLAEVRRLAPERLMVAFASDHGESLGEHGYWGHGRHLYEPGLWIPMGITWPGRILKGPLDAPAQILDLGPTLLGLVGLPVPTLFRGYDWSGILTRGGVLPMNRVTYYQTHRSAVEAHEDQTHLRRKGLLEIARVDERRKEIFRLKGEKHRVFDLVEDQPERHSEVKENNPISDDLKAWLIEVREGLAASDDLPPPSLSEEDLKALKALGYLD